jgi:hypothetical protein
MQAYPHFLQQILVLRSLLQGERDDELAQMYHNQQFQCLNAVRIVLKGATTG